MIQRTDDMKLRGLILFSALAICLLFWGCGKNKIKSDQVDVDPSNNQEDIKNEEKKKNSYLDDYKVVDLTEEDVATHHDQGKDHTDSGFNDQSRTDLTETIALKRTVAEKYNNKGKPVIQISLPGRGNGANPVADAFVKRGAAHTAKGEVDKAISDYTRAIEINPESADSFVMRAELYAAKGEHDKAISDYSNAIGLNADSNSGYDHSYWLNSKIAVVYYNRGNDFAEKHQHNKAILSFDKALELEPKFARAYNNRGTAYYNKSMSAKDVSVDIKEIIGNPMVNFLQLLPGSEPPARDFAERAFLDFTKAIELKPEYAEAYYNRGTAYGYQGHYEKAIADFTCAIEKSHLYAEAYYNRGNAYAEKGSYDKAISDYTKTIEIIPEFTEAYYNRGNVFILMPGETEKACSDWKHACELGECEAFSFGKGEGYCE